MGGRPFDEQGGVWIVTGWVLCLMVYGLVVLMYVAGFTTVFPLVVVPPVVIGLIGANSLLGGGRYGRGAPRAVTGDQAPLPSSGPNGARSVGTNGTRSTGPVLPAEQPLRPEEPPGPS